MTRAGATHVELGWVALRDAPPALAPELEALQRERFPSLAGLGHPRDLGDAVGAGLVARLVVADAARVPPSYVGQPLDAELIAALEAAHLAHEHLGWAVLAAPGVPAVPVLTGRAERRGPFTVAPLRLPPSETDATSCPICGVPNGCPMAQGGGMSEPCWCEGVVTTPRLLAMVPPSLVGKACICEPCHRRFATVSPARARSQLPVI